MRALHPYYKEGENDPCFCNYCQQRFQRRQDCDRHIAKQHMAEARGQCPDCGVYFLISELWIHMSLCTGVMDHAGSFGCGSCSDVFDNVRECEEHRIFGHLALSSEVTKDLDEGLLDM
jgi:hypothetical protein